MKSTALATALTLLLGAPGGADIPIATSDAAAAAPQPTAPPPDLGAPEDAPVLGPPMAMGPCGPEKIRPDGTLETAPHGEVEVGVGSGGYRSVGGSVCQPIGQGAAVAVSIGQTDDGGRRR